MFIDPDLAHDLMARHYVLLAFGVSVGALQVAASVSGLRGLWFVGSVAATRLLGAGTIVASTALFLLAPVWVDGPWAAGSVDADSATRTWGRASWQELAGAYNINDIHGGLSGTAQATYFPMAIAAALLVTLLVGGARSWVSRRQTLQRPGAATAPGDGLDGLATGAYPGALTRSWRVFRAQWRQDFGREFDPLRHRYGIPARLASFWTRR